MFYPSLLSILIITATTINYRHVLCKPKLIANDQGHKTSWDVPNEPSNNKNSYYRSQQQPEWSVELIPDPPAPTASIQLDIQYPNDSNQYGSTQTTNNQTDINEFAPVNKLSKHSEITLDKYLNKINQFDNFATRNNNDYFAYQKPQTIDQYYLNTTRRNYDDLYRLSSTDRVRVNPNSKFQRESSSQYKRSTNYVPVPVTSKTKHYHNDDIVKLINEQNKALSQRYLTELAMTLPPRTSLNDLLWLSDQGPSYADKQSYMTQQQIAYPVVDILSSPILLGGKTKANIRSWDEYPNYQNSRLQNRFGYVNRGKTSRVDGDQLTINMDTNDENIKYQIYEDYNPNYGDVKPPLLKQRKRDDESNMMMQPSHFSHHYEPTFLSPPIHHFNKERSTKKSSLEKVGFSVLIGSIAALISFLIISNIFLSIPLFAITIMQLLQPNQNNQIIPIPNTNPNQVMPNNGKRRKRDLDKSFKVYNVNGKNLDKLVLDLLRILKSFDDLQQKS